MTSSPILSKLKVPQDFFFRRGDRKNSKLKVSHDFLVLKYVSVQGCGDPAVTAPGGCVYIVGGANPSTCFSETRVVELGTKRTVKVSNNEDVSTSSFIYISQCRSRFVKWLWKKSNTRHTGVCSKM